MNNLIERLAKVLDKKLWISESGTPVIGDDGIHSLRPNERG